jgi:hypothetical protein
MVEVRAQLRSLRKGMQEKAKDYVEANIEIRVPVLLLVDQIACLIPGMHIIGARNGPRSVTRRADTVKDQRTTNGNVLD